MITFETIRWKNFLSTGDQWTEIELSETARRDFSRLSSQIQGRRSIERPPIVMVVGSV